MKRFITLTTRPPSGYESNRDWRARPVYIAVDAVQAVVENPTGPGCTVQISAHGNGGWDVAEDAQEVMNLLMVVWE